MRRYWLMKTEPDEFSIDDLARKKTAPWDGVRNFQARNFMKDQMKKGDLILFYHSSTEPKGVAGIARVFREAHPDPSSWDKKSPYFDPRSKPDKPLWMMVDVEFVEKFARFVSLEELKSRPDFGGMLVTRRGIRLSVQPVSEDHFNRVIELGRKRD